MISRFLELARREWVYLHAIRKKQSTPRGRKRRLGRAKKIVSFKHAIRDDTSQRQGFAVPTAFSISVSNPFNKSIGFGGQPGMTRSTGTTESTPPTVA